MKDKSDNNQKVGKWLNRNVATKKAFKSKNAKLQLFSRYVITQ